MPLKNTSGTKTEQVVSTELNIGVKTSPVAATTESLRVLPLCHIWVMLSITIMELSTIIPNPNINPDNEIMFMLIPSRYNSSNETSRDRGIVTITSSGER